MSSLENTKWLSLVSQCLSVSIEVMDTIVNREKTVVVKGWFNKSGNNYDVLFKLLSPYRQLPHLGVACVAELTHRDHSCVVVHGHQCCYHALLNL